MPGGLTGEDQGIDPHSCRTRDSSTGDNQADPPCHRTAGDDRDQYTLDDGIGYRGKNDALCGDLGIDVGIV